MFVAIHLAMPLAITLQFTKFVTLGDLHFTPTIHIYRTIFYEKGC
jgi:hypothetical protein